MAYLGVDIGGTKIVAALADENLGILGSEQFSTASTADFSQEAQGIFAVTDTLLRQTGLSKSDISGIGLSCPGPLNLKTGSISYVATTGWRDVPILEIFRRQFPGVPAALENDGDSAALAEAVLGAGKDYSVVLYFTVSTGVGGGICMDKKIYRGEGSGFTAEFGHISVDPYGERCGCGGRGCLQLFSSGTSIAARASSLARGHKNSVLHGKTNITAIDVENAVRGGDAVAAVAWDEGMEKFGIAVSILWQTLNPGIIVFGGGVSNAWDIMESGILASANERVYTLTSANSNIRLAKAKFGSKASLMGAVYLASQCGKTAQCEL